MAQLQKFSIFYSHLMFNAPSTLVFSFKNVVRYGMQYSLLLAVLFGFVFLPQKIFAADHTAFCNTITGATASECNALMDIYDNTGGASWTTKNGW
jgi:hypothetical protein